MATRAKVAKDSAALLVGTLVNGLFAYAFFALATRGLGAAAAAPVAVLWTYWGVTMAVVTFPVQHWIIRTFRADGEAAVAAALPRMAGAISIVALAAAAVSWTVDERLFHHDGPVFPLLVGLVTIGSFFTGVVRGGLAGRGRFIATAIALAADNVVRTLLGVVVLASGGRAVALGVVLVAAALIGLLWPAGYRFRTATTAPSSEGLSFLGGIATGSLLGQVVLIGGPAVLAMLGGEPQHVTMLFATLALFRAPYLLAVGVANRATGSLTGWVTSHERSRVRVFQSLVAAVTAVTAAVSALAAYAFGPAVVGAIFGEQTVPLPWVAAVVAPASIIAVGNLALSLVTIAQGRGHRLTRCWLVAIAIVAVVIAAAPVPSLARVVWGFMAGEAAAFVLLLSTGWHVAEPGTAASDRSAQAETLTM